MKSKFLLLPAILLLLVSCKVTFITGYDQVLDQTLHKIKKDFNLHFIKLSRAFQDNDSSNQAFANFQDYYDNLEADLITLKGRRKVLDSKSGIVQQQMQNLEAAFRVFINTHKAGIPDRPADVDDRHEMRDAVNSAIDAMTILQDALKTKNETN